MKERGGEKKQRNRWREIKTAKEREVKIKRGRNRLRKQGKREGGRERERERERERISGSWGEDDLNLLKMKYKNDINI